MMNVFRKYSFSLVLLLLSSVAYSQKMGRIEEVGPIPLRIEAEGFLFERFGRQGYTERPGWFVDPVGEHRQNKVQSIIFAGSRMRLSIKDDPLQLKWPSDYYYKILNRQGKDVTTLLGYPALNKTSKSSGGESLKTSAILLDTTLSVSDYLFADFYDSGTDTLIKSYYFKRIGLSPKLISPLVQGMILVSPDSSNFIRFKLPDKSIDRTLEYRLDTGAWISVGHEIRLDYLKPNSIYQLQVRYDFRPESGESFLLRSPPYWYQTGIFYSIVAFIALTGIGLVAWSVYRRKIRVLRQKRESARQQLKVVQAQLNPHFIFNSLSSIQGMINTERTNEANQYLTEFSKLMRETLNGSEKIYNQLDREVNLLNTYLRLEQFRFGFNFSIDVHETMNTSEIELPTLLIQPIVENSVKHGISGLKATGRINIRFFRENSKLIVEVADNGKGYSFDSSEMGYGLKLTTDRIRLFNEISGYKAIEFSVMRSDITITKIIFNDWL